jgi:hypothetical protein
MPTIDEAVRFLIENRSLRLGESPWPDVDDEDQEIFQIDWPKLFPRPNRNFAREEGLPYGDDWEFEPTEAELGELRDVFGAGPPPRQMPDLQGVTQIGQPQWDICAWYQPIHYFGHAWGIFIREDCVTRTAMMIARFINPAVLLLAPHHVWYRALYRAAVYVFFLHEHFHHKVECLGFRLHVSRRISAYLPYKAGVYVPTSGTDDQLEEALANADAFGRLGTLPYSFWLSKHVVEATREYLHWRFPIDPPGYRMAVHYLSKSNFDAGEDLLQTQVSEATLVPKQPSPEWELAPRMTQSFFPVTSNIWSVVRLGLMPRLPVIRVAPLRTCSTEDMVKLYKQAGYQIAKGEGKGSHVKLEKEGAPTMNLPGNRDNLSPVVAKNAMHLLGDYNLADLRRLVSNGLPRN